jgi:hypothetical protein
MPESEEDYEGKITGYPLLDGMLFGNGVPKTKTSVLIRAAELPSSIVDKIQAEFDEAGFQTGVVELPNALTKDIDLRIFVSGPSPIFTQKVLPRISERRIDPQNVPIEFIVGFFFVSTDVKLKELAKTRPNFDKDALRITTKLPKEVVVEMLSMLGIEEYYEIGNNIYLEEGMFERIQPFEEIYSEYKKESKAFASYVGTKEDMLAAKIDELMGEMDGQIVEQDGQEKKFDEQLVQFFSFCTKCKKITLHGKKQTPGAIAWCMECKT